MPVVGPAQHDGPLYRDGYQNLPFVLQAAHALGLARGAAVRLRRTRRARPDDGCPVGRCGTSRRWRPAWLSRRSADQVGQGVAVGGGGRLWDTIVAGSPPAMGQRVLLRLAITSAITTSAEAVDVLHSAAGAAALDDDHPLHQRFQDARAAAAHIQAAPPHPRGDRRAAPGRRDGTAPARLTRLNERHFRSNLADRKCRSLEPPR